MSLRIALAAGVALSACAVSAQAGEGWYVGLGAGWEKANRFEYSGLGSSGDAQSEGSWVATGALGYKFGPWRIEVEGDGSHAKFEDPYSGGTIWTGASVNAYYDIPLSERLSAYIGGGAGAAGINREAYGPLSSAGRFATWAFQYQGIGGVTYAATPNFDFYVEYRYRGVATHHAELLSPTIGPVSADSITANAVMAGIRWYPWSASAPPPPPPPPAPPAPPPPPPAPAPVKTFVVFFDFNKSNLTAEAQQVVNEAVQALKLSGAVRVLVTGHTDTVGSDSYNMGLSVRRAETVKDEMVREGVDGSSVSIEGKSYHDPLVPTGPGVREPQNRRAVIDLGTGSQ
jgi:OmpA-OmpF porin, OOP family